MIVHDWTSFAQNIIETNDIDFPHILHKNVLAPDFFFVHFISNYNAFLQEPKNHLPSFRGRISFELLTWRKDSY